MVDKVAFGRQGEIFVLRKLMDKGWKLSEEPCNMEGNDWEFEKDQFKIKIQVKTSRQFRFQHKGKRDFNFLIFNDLKDCYIIPKEILGNTDKITITFRKLKNRWELLYLTKKDLLLGINECGIKFNELNTVSEFFH